MIPIRSERAKGLMSRRAVWSLVLACWTLSASTDADAHRGRIMPDVMPLEAAGPEHIGFLRRGKFRSQLKDTKAGAIFCEPQLAEALPPDCAALVTPYPGNAFGLAAAIFHPSAMRPRPLTIREGGEIAATAIVEEPGGLEANVIVEANAVVAAGVEIGRGSVIGPGAVSGPSRSKTAPATGGVTRPPCAPHP